MAITSKLILEQSDTTHDSPVEPGKILVRTDEGALYVDTDAGERVRVGDLVQADSLAAVIPQDGKIYKVDGVLYTLQGDKLKPVSDPFPVGTILPYFGVKSTFNFTFEDFLNSFDLDIPSGWHLCDGSIFVDCTADPRDGEELYFGHNYNVYSKSNRLNRLFHFNNDTLIMCFYYYYYPYLNTEGIYKIRLDFFVKPERVGYLKTGDIADRSEYGFVYRDYVSDEFKNSNGDITLPNKVSSLDMLNHVYESENSAKVSAIDKTPFLILNGELYRLVSYNSDTVYSWKKDGGSTYRYTMKSETILNDTKPVCYTSTSLSTSDGTAERCYMRPFYPLAFAPQTIMRGYLPNLSGLMPLGTDNANLTGAILPATLPNIRGTMSNPFAVSISSTSDSELYNTRLCASPDGPFRDVRGAARYYSRGSSTKAAYSELEFDASKANPIYQDGATVRPPSFGVNWIIKV